MANQYGWNNQTPAVRAMLGSALRAPRSAPRKKRASATGAKRSKRTSGGTTKRKRRASKRTRATKLVKGSAAAKRFMAKLRAMRKK